MGVIAPLFAELGNKSSKCLHRLMDTVGSDPYGIYYKKLGSMFR